MSISPSLFLRLPVKVVGFLFEKSIIDSFVLLEGIFKCLPVGSREEFSESLQVFVWLYLRFLGDVSPDDGYLMELTHLSWNKGSIRSLESSQ